MKISMVMSTLGRFDEVLLFIRTLQQSAHDDIELIVVDQNADERLHEACKALDTRFPLHYIRSPQARGVSRGRNLGATRATGDIVCFPDDDCVYPPSLVGDVLARFAQTGCDIVCGRAAAPDGRSINGRFETQAQAVDRANVFTTQIEWVVFFRRAVFDALGGFDVDVGVGASTPWQSCEGPEITIRAIDAGYRVFYDPTLYAHHPELDTRHPDAAMRAKGRRYARGMGYVIKQHAYGAAYLARYLIRPVGGACLALLKGNARRAAYYWNVAVGRAEGYAGVCFDGARARPEAARTQHP